MGQKSKNYTENYTDNYPELDGINNLVPKQRIEISDEEIEKFADEELGTIRTDFDFGVIQGMKWYREQLKLGASQEK
jgi:hypothetical protein